MIIERTSSFKKFYKKLVASNKKLVHVVHKRIALFMLNPLHPLLRNHELKGTKEGLRSFSVTGDIRIIYYFENNTAYFVDIGTHNQVY